MRKGFVIQLLSAVLLFSFLMPGATVHGLGLKVAPLEYRSTLKANESKKGFIDISNPYGQAVTATVSVRGFKQINDDGGLEFFDDGKLSAAIKTDLTTFELKSREALRMFFVVNGNVLPKGDTYAAIFFTVNPTKAANGVGQTVSVGTLLSIINENPGERTANITEFRLPFLQLSDTVAGTYKVKNTGPTTTGFYPVVAISAWPKGKTTSHESSLLFGGRERSNDFKYKTGYGIHRLEIAYGNSKKTQWVIMVAPWLLVLTGFILLLILIEFVLLKKRRRTRSNMA